MRMIIGQAAKNFEVQDVLNKIIRLEDYRDKRLLLSFYRYAGFPLCNLRVHQLIEEYDSLHKKGLYVLAFFESPRESILKYVEKQHSPFPIVADPERSVYKDYGVESSWLLFLGSMVTKMNSFFKAFKKGYLPGRMEGEKALLPADFLIGPDLRIEKDFYGRNIGDHLPIPEIESWLGQYSV